MNYEALTLAAIRDELEELLGGGRVQRIVRPSELSIGLEVYAGQRYQLLLSAEREPAIRLFTERLRRGTEKPSPLELLLRKYVRGARLTAIRQPELERVLMLSFVGSHGPVTLVCEIMGRLSNLILVGEDETVLDAAKRIPASINRYRVILPGHPYVPPPSQRKEHPLMLTPGLLRKALKDAKRPLWRQLLALCLGMGPLSSREVVFRATGEIDPPLPLEERAYERLSAELTKLFSLLRTRAWDPCVAFAGEEPDRHPIEAAPYFLSHLGDVERCDSIFEAIALADKSTPAIGAFYSLRQRLCQAIQEALKRCERRLSSLEREAHQAEELETLKLEGQAILAMAWAIEPGQTELVVSRGQITGETGAKAEEILRIPLDPSLSPTENAQAIFRRYRRQRAAIAQLPELIARTQLEMRYLQELQTEVELAEDEAQLREVEAALEAQGYLKAKRHRRKAAKAQPLRFYKDGMVILVGRNGRQNELVTFREAGPQDLWLHAHQVPGSHVVIRNGGATVDPETLKQAAQLAAYYSAARSESQVQVDYTERRHVRKIPGAPPGMVTYRQERTLVVKPEKPALPSRPPFSEEPNS